MADNDEDARKRNRKDFIIKRDSEIDDNARKEALIKKLGQVHGWEKIKPQSRASVHPNKEESSKNKKNGLKRLFGR